MQRDAEKKALAAIDAWVKLWRAESAAAKSRHVREAVASAAAYLLEGPAKGDAGELLEAADAVLNGRAATASDLIAIALKGGTAEAKRLDLALRETLRARGAPLTARSVGHALSSCKGARLANGRRLIAAAYRNHSRLWRIATP